jgi:hypothetical protein
MTAEVPTLAPVGEHLDPQLLGSYHEGHLSPAEETAVQCHLASCRACTDLALEVVEFLDGDAEPTPETSRKASDLASRLLRLTAPAAPPVPWGLSGWRVAAALFCALLVGAVSYNLGLSEASRRRGPVTAERLTVIELTDSMQRHGTAGEREQTVEQPQGRTAILLTPGFLEPFSRYQVRIMSEGKGELGQVILAADRTGVLYLAIPGEDLPPGRYLFEILPADGGEEALATLPLKVLPAGGGD